MKSWDLIIIYFFYSIVSYKKINFKAIGFQSFSLAIVCLCDGELIVRYQINAKLNPPMICCLSLHEKSEYGTIDKLFSVPIEYCEIMHSNKGKRTDIFSKFNITETDL